VNKQSIPLTTLARCLGRKILIRNLHVLLRLRSRPEDLDRRPVTRCGSLLEVLLNTCWVGLLEYLSVVHRASPSADTLRSTSNCFPNTTNLVIMTEKPTCKCERQGRGEPALTPRIFSRIGPLRNLRAVLRTRIAVDSHQRHINYCSNRICFDLH
jgi:hypothetical protein